MLLETHSIEIEATGEKRTLAEWGFKSAQIVCRNDGMDVLAMVATRAPAETALFPMHSRLILRDGAEVKRFVGRVGLPSMIARGGVREQQYQVEGMTWEFARHIYRQVWKIASVNEMTGAVTYTEEPLSMVNLFRNAAGAELTVSQEVAAILDYAIAQGLDFTYDLTNLPTVRPPADEQLDLTINDALAAVLQWCPDVSRGWDYSGAQPRLYFSRGVVLEGVMLHGPEEFTVRTVALGELADYRCAPRDDLLTPVVRINYLRPIAVEMDDGTTRVPLNVSRDTSTEANGAFGVSESTVRLSDLQWTGSGFTPPEDAPAAGLAAALHAGFARLAFELDFSIPSSVVNWGPKPGEVWCVNDAGADLALAFSVCQSVTRDLRTGLLTMKCGLASSLGLSARLQLLRPNRKRQVPGSTGEMQYGFGKDDEAAAVAANAMGMLALWVYDGTTSIKVTPGQLCGDEITTIGGTGDWTFARETCKIYLKVVLFSETNEATTREIRTGPTVPEPTQDATTDTGYLELATVTVDGGVATIVPAYAGNSRWAALVWGKVSCSGGTLSQPRSLVWS